MPHDRLYRPNQMAKQSLPPQLCRTFLPALLSITAALMPGMLSAQSVRISEFMAANNTIYPDNHDFDDYSDWIELENTTGAPIDLSNYFLSDDPTLPLRWHIPSGTVIPANGFLVIRADGFNAAPGETHRRDSAPWDNFQTTRHHTNFKLGSIGESVVLTELDTPAQNTTYLALGDSWKYFDQGSLPAANWHTSAYNDTTWPNGNSELGYGDGDENTVVSYGPSDAQKYPTTYFRTTFNVTDPSAIGELNCRAKIDDGAVLYINGTEVGRPRMGSGTISYETLSQSSASESTFDDIIIPIGTIVTGTNVIAVEVHQRSQSSSDISLNVEITAVEFSSSPTTIDSVTYGPQVDDISYGRNPANGGNWTYFGDPTPNAANTSFPSANRSASGGLSVSPAGGFYSGTQNVVLSTGAVGATIRYTLDGSVPSSTSTAYAGPIAIPATRVLRARTFEAGMVPGALETHTYFIDEPLSPLPVVGFTVEPDKFFDNDLGIYENVYKGREASNSVEFYAPDRSPAFKVNSGTKIGGENIWRFAQKPLNIAMRGKYGDDLINYHFFPSEPFGNFDAIGFRNGGDNWNDAMLRDPMSPSIVRGQMNNDVAWYRPVVLYLNGAYWGIHNARLRMGDSYFAQRYQIQPGGFDLLVKEHAPPSGDTELVVKDGDSDAYLAFETYVDSTDMTVQANYDAAVAQMDLDNFMDYCALVDFVYESSWHHNQEFWRERKSGAKWKWNINDIDRGFSGSRVTSSLIDDLKSRHPIFDSLRRNTGFKNRFVQRYAAHMSSTFHPARIADIIDGLAAEVDPEIPRHIARWDADGGFSASKRDSEIAEVKQFAIDRASNVFGDHGPPSWNFQHDRESCHHRFSRQRWKCSSQQRTPPSELQHLGGTLPEHRLRPHRHSGAGLRVFRLEHRQRQQHDLSIADGQLFDYLELHTLRRDLHCFDNLEPDYAHRRWISLRGVRRHRRRSGRDFECRPRSDDSDALRREHLCRRRCSISMAPRSHRSPSNHRSVQVAGAPSASPMQPGPPPFHTSSSREPLLRPRTRSISRPRSLR